MNDIAQKIRNKAKDEELNYSFLKSCLSDYRFPRNQISKLVEAGVLIRVKKGLFVFGDNFRQKLIVKETLANLIYGPSYISLDYAMGFYGLIPERVEMLTSITTKRNKMFYTPLGSFSYKHLPLTTYRPGIRHLQLDSRHFVFMASIEKAVLDKFWFGKHSGIRNLEAFKAYLFDDLRFDSMVLRTLKPKMLKECSKAYKSKRIQAWTHWLIGECL